MKKKTENLLQDHLGKGVVYFALPENIILSHLWSSPTVCVHHQAFHLGQQGANGSVLLTQEGHLLHSLPFDVFIKLLHSCNNEEG